MSSAFAKNIQITDGEIMMEFLNIFESLNAELCASLCMLSFLGWLINGNFNI